MIEMESLEEAVNRIVVHAGIEPPHRFHLHQVSPSTRGFFILEVAWPAGARIVRAVRRAAPSLPLLTYPGYIALLPQVAEEIITAAHRLGE